MSLTGKAINQIAIAGEMFGTPESGIGDPVFMIHIGDSRERDQKQSASLEVLPGGRQIYYFPAVSSDDYQAIQAAKNGASVNLRGVVLRVESFGITFLQPVHRRKKGLLPLDSVVALCRGQIPDELLVELQGAVEKIKAGGLPSEYEGKGRTITVP